MLHEKATRSSDVGVAPTGHGSRKIRTCYDARVVRARAGFLVVITVVSMPATGCGTSDDAPLSSTSTEPSSSESTAVGTTANSATVTSTTPPASTSDADSTTSGPSSGDGTTSGTTGPDATTGQTTGIEGDMLVLDPRTLVYFDLAIDSIRFAVGGHDPQRDACVSIIFNMPDPDLEALYCDDFVLDNGPGGFPYVLITPGASPPCYQWDYFPNVDAVAASGCMQAHPFDMPFYIDIDMSIEIDSELFAGTITVDNQAP
jgi:hypothetical protein